MDEFIQNLTRWVSIPSVSTDIHHQSDVIQAANYLKEHFSKIGLDNAAVLQTKGHPVVYADWLHAGDEAPTILVYGHYDVQPAVVEDGWDTEPFDPVVRDGILYARGATDDKGQNMIQFSAMEAILACTGCGVNVKYLIEGEEEIGSPHLGEFLEENKEMLKADMCLISDTGIQGKDQPSMMYALRGLVTMTVTVSGPKKDLHSGLGGMIHNPAQVICEIISKLHDEDGTVSVPGFYDDVLDLEENERKELAKSDITQEQWEDMMGDLPDWGEPGYTKVERQGARPTLEINGISSGYSGEGFKTVLPSTATAKISARIVANQNPDDIFEKIKNRILSITPNTVHIEVKMEHGGFPALTPIDHPGVRAAMRAYEENFPNAPLLQRCGGSIPIVTEIQRVLDVPVVLLGFGLPDCNAHGPNECFHLDHYQKGILTVISYFSLITQYLSK
eukprot:TRINITY_DN9769_c0_g1_i1.p1 TRINITY_DN9769_c0_g1~~TRINITY_DN9769_c0_g1_i1.p1  ORF type:complete len:468 (+),score=111.69 TRINITY_DN9769_c0_g1_i1:65-1405(+)